MNRDIGRERRAGRSELDAHRTAKAPFEVELYSGTAHGFSRPKDKAEERAIAQAKATTGRTLKELFGV